MFLDTLKAILLLSDSLQLLSNPVGLPSRFQNRHEEFNAPDLWFWHPQSILQHCNCLSTALTTIICSRLSDVAQFQSCSFWPDFHTGLAFLVTAEQLHSVLKKKQNVSGCQRQAKPKNPNKELEILSLQHLNIVLLSKSVTVLNLCVLILEPIQLISQESALGKVASPSPLKQVFLKRSSFFRVVMAKLVQLVDT